MQRVAADVGYSETAFLIPGAEPGAFAVRYFSPLAEVPFCGHATIAAAVAHARRNGPGPLRFATMAGPVAVRTDEDATGIDHRDAGQRAAADRRPRAGRSRRAAGRAGLVRRGAGPGAAAAGRVRGRLAPGARRRDPGPPRRPRLRLRPARRADGRARLDDRRAGIPRAPDAVARAQPVPAGRRAGGPGHRGRGRRVRRLPARAGPRHAAGHGHRAPGRRPRPPRRADRADPDRSGRRHRGVRLGGPLPHPV